MTREVSAARAILRTGVTGAVVVGLSAMSLVAGTAYATPPGAGVTAKLLYQTTVGNTDYTLREITVPPGQSTGWHYHDGPLYGFVKQGTLSHFDAGCEPDGTYPAGRTITEPPGPGHVHIGRNEGSVPVVLDVLYVLPHGSPFSEDAPNPGCDFQ
ncbi:cupin domain-containing protein [Streptomyces sp. NBC_01728]|uniref:cupin domain-containing protein n=1 Tax=unclassified Streptomyces TaxID=2593676 RepID=UPI0022540FE3|nr:MULTISPECIES: cupin domain-containing protein [unclassified Streptomyces]MCX4457635.1 cupin domain-containing protein [Streptomyces sp. NBC_01719]MCX4496992.1 cupin domain-containing protein [Streptomyces sp. NBC_01728]